MNTAKLITCSEKSHYPFKRYPSESCDTVLFPGCAFPSQFPRTMDALAELCRTHGIGIAYDCCGHPLDGFGVQGGTDRVLSGIARRLKKRGCTRVVAVCPNCLNLLQERLGIPTISVFELFEELGVRPKGTFEPGVLFTPCPDLRHHEMRDALRRSCDLSAVDDLKKVGCCGLLPKLAAQGPDVVRRHTQRVFDAADGRRIYTYCASCLGQFARLGNSNCQHAVSVFLGVEEAPDAKRAFWNRAKRKFDANVNPYPAMKA
ncbi:heterodisulfide reductase-related iron-sulfur binding cluster [Adlercreutzia sp. ZJ138]|uniref:heterodisulfide reductase-related iron-sulfur binding cluster n=1 Tax=Adlercreutzia sp. ZJ138 TaxID=2709405 RepID=UPI0013EAEB05|nr:heterodisulfide reductase-related iron-sulfur binding cluster [Adlercreutzia sp. ZJ138]